MGTKLDSTTDQIAALNLQIKNYRGSLKSLERHIAATKSSDPLIEKRIALYRQSIYDLRRVRDELKKSETAGSYKPPALPRRLSFMGSSAAGMGSDSKDDAAATKDPRDGCSPPSRSTP